MQLPILTKRRGADASVVTNTPSYEYRDAKINMISVDLISPNRYQPRRNFDSVSLLRLADSIKRYGILQPITVRAVNNDGNTSYEIICGERRLRAAIIAGLTSVPCNIINSTDIDSAELSIIENLLRDDLNMFEQAESFHLLITTFNLTQEEVASRVLLSQSAVANKLRLLRFTPEERKLILDNGLTERHARSLLRIHDATSRIRFIKLIAKDKLNVASTETLVDNFLQYLSDNATHSDKASNSPNTTKKQTGIVKDLRVLTNTIENAAALLRKSGISVDTKSEETQDAYIVTISVYKK
ncbi:MAG: ParB/RepB/Spo0J family partition protein [Clostridiales bacterium]|nr:ParB/RepB/Spo0J family partition protein [Clostridiales bacterium]